MDAGSSSAAKLPAIGGADSRRGAAARSPTRAPDVALPRPTRRRSRTQRDGQDSASDADQEGSRPVDAELMRRYGAEGARPSSRRRNFRSTEARRAGSSSSSAAMEAPPAFFLNDPSRSPNEGASERCTSPPPDRRARRAQERHVAQHRASPRTALTAIEPVRYRSAASIRLSVDEIARRVDASTNLAVPSPRRRISPRGALAPLFGAARSTNTISRRAMAPNKSSRFAPVGRDGSASRSGSHPRAVFF
mgnify:CR=1 FL=1